MSVEIGQEIIPVYEYSESTAPTGLEYTTDGGKTWQEMPTGLFIKLDWEFGYRPSKTIMTDTHIKEENA
jgi:hypothetical protein